MITKSVLIVEDHEDTANLLERVLGRYGWAVEHVSTLSEGIYRANSCPYPEIIILDLDLPDSNTDNTIAHIHEVMRNGPVIVQSNNTDPEIKSRIEHLGAVFWIKDFTEGYAQRLFDRMIESIDSWKELKIRLKKDTSCIDKNLLKMAAVDSAMNANG